MSESVRYRPTRELLRASPTGDRIIHHNIRFRHHNNPRYEELLPRLRRVDLYATTLSGPRVMRGLEFRGLRYSRKLWKPLIQRVASRKYRWLFSTDAEQLPFFLGKAVVDVDDPVFTQREAALLNQPSVAAYVVTAEEAAHRFTELGVRKPYHVIPQGVSLSDVSETAIEAARQRRRDGEFVAGFVSAHLLTKGDRGGDNPQYNIDHLLDLWKAISQAVPSARLWLIGNASPRTEAKCRSYRGISILGPMPRPEALAHIANFDVALYPRLPHGGVRAVKISEYLGMGAPIVSYDYEPTREAKDRGAGIMVDTSHEFVDAVERLARDAELRERLAAAGRRAKSDLSWETLASKYEQILDEHLN